MTFDTLTRFVEAQENQYATALQEIKNGRKRSHWMWYIFPQIQGLGRSRTAQYYAIADRQEAEAYLAHPVLGARLREISAALLTLKTDDPHQVMGSPDDLKLHSSMTLFHMVSGDPVFKQVLDKFFGGAYDKNTIDRLDSSQQ